MVDGTAPGIDDMPASRTRGGHQPFGRPAVMVRQLIGQHLGIEADRVINDATFREDLGADSLDSFELIMAFEEAFGIEIPDADAPLMGRVGDARLHRCARGLGSHASGG